MKKIICSLVAVSLILISCGSDDSDDAANNSAAGVIGIGGWDIVSDSSKTEPLTMCDLASRINFGDVTFSDSQVDQGNDDTCIFQEAIRSQYRLEGNRIVRLTDSGAVMETDTVTTFSIEGDVLTLTDTFPTGTRVRTFRK